MEGYSIKSAVDIAREVCSVSEFIFFDVQCKMLEPLSVRTVETNSF